MPTPGFGAHTVVVSGVVMQLGFDPISGGVRKPGHTDIMKLPSHPFIHINPLQETDMIFTYHSLNDFNGFDMCNFGVMNTRYWNILPDFSTGTFTEQSWYRIT